MERPILDQRALIALLNWELAAYAECDGCHFTSIRRMADPAVYNDHREAAEVGRRLKEQVVRLGTRRAG